MTTAQTAAANGSAPAIDARDLRSARKRTLTAAKKALQALDAAVTSDRGELDSGNVPPQPGLRKAADKYLGLLKTLDIQDALLTPEALEAIYAEHSEAGQVSVSREDLAVFARVISQPQVLAVLGLPQEVPEDSPLARLSAAAGLMTPEMAAAVSMPAAS